MRKSLFAVGAVALSMATSSLAYAQGEDRQLFWGDTHLHTSNSFDAYMNENLSADPQTAYNYAKGVPVEHPYTKHRVQIETPLDFLVIADHAELLGVIRTVNQKGIPTEGLGLVDRFRAWLAKRWIDGVIEDKEGMAAFVSFLPEQVDPVEAAAQPNEAVDGIPNNVLMSKNTWDEATQLADENYEPGKFTTFIGWEWSSIPGGANLHRVVFTTNGADKAQNIRPYSLADSQYPQDLWAWLDKTSEEQGMEFISIPHNSNISKGYMFPEVTIKGEPVSADYAKLRAKWEPVAEVTQIKGDSETIGKLSPNDEFADFETYSFYIEQDPAEYNPQEADYARSALKNGLKFEKELGVNPFKFGMIGATDSHVGVPSAEEDNFHGKMAIHGIPANNNSAGIAKRGADGPIGWNMSASGLAAVWAEKNDRDSIMAAFKRKEVYATTGPRMAVRMFGGWSFNEADMIGNIAGAGYAKGVPMGGDLTKAPEGKAPTFLLEALRDPMSGNLDRVQVVKGWVDAGGETHEKIFNVVWAGDRKLDGDGKLPAVGNTVDLKTATFTNTIGANHLSTFWSDPEFDPAVRAFYYVRVLEIPTPRYALKDALALGLDKPTRNPSIIQERAYTSPIWYTP